MTIPALSPVGDLPDANAGAAPSRLLIADDEPLARARLRTQILELAAGEVVGEASTGLEALELALQLHPDIALLDIRMPGMDGIELARHQARLPQVPSIIFTTAYNEHALAAFEAHAIDYLLKPIRQDRLRTALSRARLLSAAQLRELARERRGTVARSHFSAISKGSLRIVPLAGVRYLQADQGYVTVRHIDGELLIEDSLRTLEEEFGDAFLRIHRHTLVARAHVLGLERDALGNCTVLVRDVADKLVVSRRLVSEVRRKLRVIAAGADEQAAR